MGKMTSQIQNINKEKERFFKKKSNRNFGIQ